MLPRRPNSLRLQGYDYGQAGMYFVTVVVKDRKQLFGEIVNETMMLNEARKIVEGVWNSLTKQFPVTLDEFVVMPNHVHGIIVFEHQTHKEVTNLGVGLAQPQKSITIDEKLKTNSRPTQNESPTNDTQRVGLEFTANKTKTSLAANDNKRPTPTLMDNKRVALSDIIRFFKSLSAKRVNIVDKMPGRSIWQTGFHDRIIRDEEELNAVRAYTQTNPLRWALDKEAIV